MASDRPQPAYAARLLERQDTLQTRQAGSSIGSTS